MLSPELFIISLSLVLFLFSLFVFVYKKIDHSKGIKILFVALLDISILFFVLYYVANYFTGDGINSGVIYYLTYGLSGAGFLEYPSLILTSSFLILFGVSFSIWIVFKRKPRKYERYGKYGEYRGYLEHREYREYKYTSIILISIFLSLLINPVTIALTEVVFDNTGELDKNFEFYKYYKIPKIEQVGEQKNLVVIYAESLERAYFNQTAFSDLTKNLLEIESESISFTDINQDKYSRHTIGGMVATQCGFPLISPSPGNSMSGMDEYLESAICLGDLLNKEGYYLAYSGGASNKFGGKDKFYSSHGFEEINGKEELLTKLKDESYKTSWGLYDDSLLDLTYSRFMELSESKELFALFTLTLDTHDAHYSKSCDNVNYNGDSNHQLNSIVCSDYLISNFIKRIRNSEYSNNTVIVIVSDHLKTGDQAIVDNQSRKNLFLINSPDVSEGFKDDTPGLTIDIGSTILPYMGYRGDIGMGRDLSKLKENPKERIENILNNLNNFRPYIMQFWSFPDIKENIKIDINKGKIFIDERGFEFPTLIEFNDKLETKIYFEFNLPPHVDTDGYFFLVDKCIHLEYLFDIPADSSEDCLLYGNNNENDYCKLTSDVEFSIENILDFFDSKSIDKNDYCKPTSDVEVPAKEPSDFFDSKSIKNDFKVKRVAHAGGEINGITYTNSLNALDKNMEEGFSYFEIDFAFTKDGHLVCLHKWNSDFNKLFGFETEEKLTLNEFEKIVNSKSEFEVCTLEKLIIWMDENPETHIITDVKENNIQALELISKKVPNFQERIIPQIYSFENFDKVKKMGYNQVILTIYRYNLDDDEILTKVEGFGGDFAITIPKKRAMSNLSTELAKMDIHTYTYTINSLEEKEILFDVYNISEIYTDFLGPYE